MESFAARWWWGQRKKIRFCEVELCFDLTQTDFRQKMKLELLLLGQKEPHFVHEATLFSSQAHTLRVSRVSTISRPSGLVASLQPLTLFTFKTATFSTKLPRPQEKNTSNGRNPVPASWAHVPSWPSWLLGSGSCIKPARAAAPSILTYPRSFVRLSLGEVAEMLLVTLWDLTETWQLCPVLLGFPSLLSRAAQEKDKYITSVSSAGQAGTETKAAVRILPVGWEQVGG